MMPANMKKIGFLSFGHWSSSPYSDVRTASDTLLQSIDLAVAAEELGLDGAYFRVHHFAAQLASPFPLLAAIGARASTIAIGTAVIALRYENPLHLGAGAGPRGHVELFPIPRGAVVSPPPPPRRLSPPRPACPASSHIRRGCATGSG